MWIVALTEQISARRIKIIVIITWRKDEENFGFLCVKGQIGNSSQVAHQLCPKKIDQCYLPQRMVAWERQEWIVCLIRIALRLEAIASRLEAIALRLEAIALQFEAIASRLEAITILFRLEAIAIRLEAIATSLEAVASRLEAIAIRWH